jgi:hypothetical protein
MPQISFGSARRPARSYQPCPASSVDVGQLEQSDLAARTLIPAAHKTPVQVDPDKKAEKQFSPLGII